MERGFPSRPATGPGTRTIAARGNLPRGRGLVLDLTAPDPIAIGNQRARPAIQDMTNFRDILDLYSPARTSKHVQDYPAQLLHGTARTPRPELQVVVGICSTWRTGS